MTYQLIIHDRKTYDVLKLVRDALRSQRERIQASAASVRVVSDPPLATTAEKTPESVNEAVEPSVRGAPAVPVVPAEDNDFQDALDQFAEWASAEEAAGWTKVTKKRLPKADSVHTDGSTDGSPRPSASNRNPLPDSNQRSTTAVRPGNSRKQKAKQHPRK